MALDVSLCIVPSQFDELVQDFLENDPENAELVAHTISALHGKHFTDFADPAWMRLKQKADALRQFYSYTEDDFFYDRYRCSATLDYLLDAYIAENNILLTPGMIWKGGNVISEKIIAGQGIPIRLYDHSQIENIHHFLSSISFGDLLPFYDYEKMKEAGVYKLSSQRDDKILEETFSKLRTLFRNAANNAHVYLFKKID